MFFVELPQFFRNDQLSCYNLGIKAFFENNMLASLLFLTASMTYDSHLPPLLPWEGESLSLIQQAGPLTTDFELSDGYISPDYNNTMAFVERLVAANPTQFKSQIIGFSNSKRAIKMVVATEQGFLMPISLPIALSQQCLFKREFTLARLTVKTPCLCCYAT